MLKEKQYFEYQEKYKKYREKHKDVEKLGKKVRQLEAEKANQSVSIEREKTETVRAISDRLDAYETAYASVKKNGADSPEARRYSEQKLQEIENLEAMLRSLKSEKDAEIKELQKKKKDAVKGLEADRELCRKRLNDLMNGGDESPFEKVFDESRMRRQLEKDKERKMTELASQYDTSIAGVHNALQNIDNEYGAILKSELACIEEDVKLHRVYADLCIKRLGNELPQVITDVLEDPVRNVIQRNGINSGQGAAQIAKAAEPLSDLRRYTPVWLIKLVEIGFPCMVGGALFLFFLFSGVRLDFVTAAANTIAVFLVRLFCAAVGFAILFGILNALKGRTVGAIGGALGGIIGLLVALGWDIVLPAGFTDGVEWVVKTLICLAAGAGIWFLNTHTGAGDFLVGLGMTLGFVRKAALAQQGYAIRENADSYYVLLRYKEIICFIVENHKARRSAHLKSDLERLQAEKTAAIKALDEKLDREAERKIADERSSADAHRQQYEQGQMDLIQMQDECMLELSGYDGRIREKEDSFDEKIKKKAASFDKKITDANKNWQKLKADIFLNQEKLLAQLENDRKRCEKERSDAEENYRRKKAESEANYNQKIAECQADMKKKESEYASDVEEMDRLFEKINSETVKFDESRGVLSDYIYLFKENTEESPKSFAQIQHDKKPIIFLYEDVDSANIAGALFEFMQSVLTGLYTINAKDSFDLIIMDPVSKARKFEQLAQDGFLSIENDIKKLSGSIQNSMREVAKKGMHIDDYNRKMSEDGEDKVRYFRYQIVEFIVPEEEAAQNTDFFDSDLWGTLGDGKENGFLPIFYIRYSDWKETFDDSSRMNSKFIKKLRQAIGPSNGSVYRINVQKITAEKLS